MRHRTDWSAIAVIALLSFASIAGCMMNRSYEYEPPQYGEEVYDPSFGHDPILWEQFLECSKDQGDAGCEECFITVFGYPSEPHYFCEIRL